MNELLKVASTTYALSSQHHLMEHFPTARSMFEKRMPSGKIRKNKTQRKARKITMKRKK